MIKRNGVHETYGKWVSGLVMLLTCLLFAACQKDEAQETVENQNDMYQLKMTICLQPNMDMTAFGGDIAPNALAPTRAMGDPGTYEHFAYPRYFYIYVVGFTDPEGAYPESTGGTVIPVNDEDKEVNRIDVGDDPSKWVEYAMTVDPPQTLHDLIYGCTTTVSFKSPSDDIKKLRVYVAASPVPLKYNGHELGVKVGDDDQVFKFGEKNETDVLDLMFDIDNDLLEAGLQNVYSSPYNYCPASTYGGKYYYTINDPKKSEDITRIIYHVAAKVDVMWNVDKSKQADLQLSYIEARKLKKHNCLLFRPTENIWDATDEGDNYSLELMAEGDVGSQWYGRNYIYTIPFRKDDNGDGTLQTGERYFDTSLHILKRGDDKTAYAGGGYDLTIRKDMTISRYNIFVPWLRSDIVFTSSFGGMTYTSSTPQTVVKYD